MPAVAKEDLKVGVIHIGNPADGSGYSYTHDQGIVAMQKAVGLEDDQIIRKNNVADDDQTAIETAMRECVEEGCQIIFATSWGYMDACEALAEEYPDVIFSHATGYKSNGVNFNNYFGRRQQKKLPDRECFVTLFRQGSYTPLRRLCVYPLWTCRPQTA